MLALPFLSRYPVGTNVYSRDWDLLIVLDTCRLDAIKTVRSEYEFLNDITSITSVGSKTSEWVAQTFVEEYRSDISNTALISANPWTHRILKKGVTPEEHAGVPFAWTNWSTVDSSCFQQIENAWRYEATGEYGHEEGPTPAEYVTDRAVELGRSTDADRYVVHYVQPHAPYTREAYESGRKLREKERNFDLYLRAGHSKDEIWDLYIKELRYVLDSLSTLLNNFDAEKTVITADHGEGFGEWAGYEHPVAVPHPKVRKVPWVETTATDTENYQPETKRADEPTKNVKQHLETLGYH